MNLLPLGILAVLHLIGLGISIGKSGEPQGNYSGWISLISIIISWGLILWAVL